MSLKESLRNLYPRYTAKRVETKGDALRKGVPRLLSDSPKIREIGWKILRSKFSGSQALKIYKAVNEAHGKTK